MVPDALRQWLDTNYPAPRVDEEWLEGCYDWVTSTHGLTPEQHLPAIIDHVQSQLLQSDLTDSMAHGTGIPLPLLTAAKGVLKGPVLVEIIAITEVGASAINLDAVRVVREERMGNGEGEAQADGEEADLDVVDEGPVPNYPRSMLRFQLSDGASTIGAFEYRPIPELTLGVTPLGYKLVLKEVMVRNGMAFLEPKCIEIKGHRTEDREVMQKSDFARGLRQRLGRPEPPPPPPVQARSPLREISPPPSPPNPVVEHADDEDQPRRRKVPAPPSSDSPVTSNYFSSSSAPVQPTGLSLPSTRTSGPIEIDSDSENDAPQPRIPPGLEQRPVVPLKSSSQSKRDSPEFDCSDVEFNEEALEELQKLEDQAMGRDVITIDDDDEEMQEDKENVPAPQRHVRRKVFGDVIDISDSD
ncbi:DUF1767 domain-containing protein [Mycena indigotica]|uniref:RecQ-mediated genome instability protein 1 n=1 Tax=Mycena indigotica TaxID=2126181 RepID=A0A8H6T7Y3_9AGAR|nr:DUF1767 domain-containing protein [Mycena indigotica]KAF7312424.1 DUF1767 domain-containing protein [Mycena indigotica]